MAGTTPLSQLPYPTGTDRVADGDNAIQALADKLDALVNTSARTAFTLGPNMTGSAAGWRRGLTVFVNVNVTTTVGAVAGATLFTVPTGWRPSEDWFWTLILPTATENPLRAHANANGTCTIQGGTNAGSTVRGSTAWPISSVTAALVREALDAAEHPEQMPGPDPETPQPKGSNDE